MFSLIDLAADLGFDGVNVSFFPPEYVEIGGRDGDHLQRVRDHVERRGIGIDLETSGTAPAHLAGVLRIAGTVGARYLRTYTTGPEAGAARVDKAIGELRSAAALAEEVGIPILLENHEDLCGVDVASILAAVDSPWVGALFDYVNSLLFGEDPGTALDALAPWIRSAHLKDCVLLPAEPEAALPARLLGVPIGDGTAPVLDLTSRLVALGVGRICFENTWSYAAPLRHTQPGPASGGREGRFVDRPLVGPGEMIDIAGLRATDPERVVELERWALRRSMAWLDAQIRPLMATSPGMAGPTARAWPVPKPGSAGRKLSPRS